MSILNEIMTPAQLRVHLDKNKPGTVKSPGNIKRPSEDNIAKMKLILKERGYRFEQEFRFHPTRKWRFDIAFPGQKIAIEYEGIKVAKDGKSRHTTLCGYTADAEKYNAAQSLGWKVLRYTAKNWGNVLDDLKGLL